MARSTENKFKYPRELKYIIKGEPYKVRIKRDLRAKSLPYEVVNTQKGAKWLNLKRFSSTQEVAANKYFDKVARKLKKASAPKIPKRKPLNGGNPNRASKPVGGTMATHVNVKEIEIRNMKPAQRFRFPRGKASYTFRGFDASNQAKYRSDKGEDYKTKKLFIKVVLV